MSKKEDTIKTFKELKTFTIHETNMADVEYVARLLKGYKHIENILNILLKQEYDKAKIAQETLNQSIIARFEKEQEEKKKQNTSSLKNKEDKKPIALKDIEKTQIELDTEKQIWLIFNLLKNAIVMKAVLSGNKGKKATAENVATVNQYFKNNQLFAQMISTCLTDDFNDKNLSMVVRRVATAWNNFFASVKEYMANPSAFTGFPSYPKPKKLAKLTNFSLPLGPDKLSINIKNKRKKNKFGITLGKKQKLFHLGKECEYISSKEINSATVCYSHGHIYYAFTYLLNEFKLTVKQNNQRKKEAKEKISNLKKQAPKKVAGLDIGLHNLLSIYINDEQTQSLIVSGKELISYNSNFNKRLSKIASDLTKNVAEYKEVETSVTDDEGKVSTKISQVPKEYNSVGKYLVQRRSQIFERRRLFQEDYLQKVSKKVVQYLVENEVDRLVMSKNLSFAKQKGEIQMNKQTKQKFYQLSFGRLINLIQSKAENANILVDLIDEAYTSKTSSLSADVNAIVKKAKKDSKSLKPTDFSGSRGCKQKGNLKNPLGRGFFKDNVLNKVVNADLNAAANHVKVAFPKISINKDLWKFCNPVKTKTTHELTQFIKRNNELNKLKLVQ